MDEANPEAAAFGAGVLQHGKDFGAIHAGQLPQRSTQQLVLLRRPFLFRPRGPAGRRRDAVLHITAQPIPNRLGGPRHGGSLASKLLCAYKAWVNGVPLGVGPGRPTGANSTREDPALLFDSVDVSAYLHRDAGRENVLAVESFYWTAAQEARQVGCPPGESAFCAGGRSTDLDPTNPRDVGGVLAWLDDGAGGAPLLHTGDGGWSVWGGGDRALSVDHGVTNGQYHQPHEFYDMRHYPDYAWRSAAALPPPSSGAAGWVAPHIAPPFTRLSSKGIPGIRMETVAAASFRALQQRGEGCYVVDFGAIIQGGLDVTFLHGEAGQCVGVFAGEVLYADGSVKWWEDDLNDTEYRAVWTLRDGEQRIVPPQLSSSLHHFPARTALLRHSPATTAAAAPPAAPPAPPAAPPPRSCSAARLYLVWFGLVCNKERSELEKVEEE